MKAAIPVALVLALAAGGSAAQAVHKSTMPDGTVIYSEKPAPGASRVEKLEPPPAKTGVTGLTPQEKMRAQEQAQRRKENAAETAQSQKSVESARKQLQQAEAARDAGKEPLPTERTGIAGGGSRLNEAYFARQKALEEAVANARKRLAEAQQEAR